MSFNAVIAIILIMICIAIFIIMIYHLYGYMLNKEITNRSLDTSHIKIKGADKFSKELSRDLVATKADLSGFKEQSAADLQNVHNTIDDEKTRVQSALDYLSTKYREIQVLYETIQASINSLSYDHSQKIASVSSDVSKLQEEYSKLSDEVDRNTRELSQRDVQVLRAQVGDVARNQASMMADLQVLKSQSNGLANGAVGEIDDRNKDIMIDLRLISRLVEGDERIDIAVLQEMINDIVHKNNAIVRILTVMDEKIIRSDAKISNMTGSFGNYFHFNDIIGSEGSVSDRVVGKNGPELGFATLTRHTQGMRVMTPESLVDDKNLKVCNRNNNCINLNANDSGFNITPENLNNLTINTKNELPMARFDMESNSIYLGGADMNAPLFIRDNNMYINNINMILKEPGTKITEQNVNDLPTLRLTGEDIYQVAIA